MEKYGKLIEQSERICVPQSKPPTFLVKRYKKGEEKPIFISQSNTAILALSTAKYTNGCALKTCKTVGKMLLFSPKYGIICKNSPPK